MYVYLSCFSHLSFFSFLQNFLLFFSLHHFHYSLSLSFSFPFMLSFYHSSLFSLSLSHTHFFIVSHYFFLPYTNSPHHASLTIFPTLSPFLSLPLTTIPPPHFYINLHRNFLHRYCFQHQYRPLSTPAHVTLHS